MKSSIITIALGATGIAHAALSIDLPGSTRNQGWNELTSTNFGAAQGFPGYPTAANPWPSPIAANAIGSTGSATLNKLAGAGYFASSSLYDTGFSGTYQLVESAPLVDLATVIFQADVGTVIGRLPVLNYNGGTQALAADFHHLSEGAYLTFDFNTGESFPTNNHLWQWDLSAIVDPISSYEILWGSHDHEHLTQYEFTLTSSDSFAQAIPEPNCLVLLSLASLTGFRRRRSS